MLSEKKQEQKTVYCLIAFIGNSRKDKNRVIKKQTSRAGT
jgi:hypothetical protein